MTGYKIMGMAEEGKCQHCGANCPKRRVYVMPVDADGNRGEVEAWGVICASKVRGERGTATQVDYLSRFAKMVDRIRQVVEAGGDYEAIRRVNNRGYVVYVTNGVVQVFNYGSNVPDAEIPMPVAAA
jgi:hypothetical protein